VSLPPLASVVREFWGHVGDGCTAAEAGVAVGVSRHTGVRWFGDAGGVKPRLVEPTTSGPRPRMCLQERIEIDFGVRSGESLQSIGRRLGRPASTIKREIDTNGLHNRHNRGRQSGYRRKEAFGARQSGRSATVRYCALTAQGYSDRRARRPKPGKLAVNDKLHDEVQARLLDEHSPQQIAKRLCLDFPDDAEMRVSHETIYQSIYVQGKGNLRRELHTCLRTGRALRKPHRRADERRGRLTDMVNISERPATVADRAVPGHWEGDLIVGAASGSAIGTVVERSTRFVMLLHLPDGHTAEAVQEAIVVKMAALPAILRKTLTWDQGKEMANHAQIAKAADLKIYFCDPHSPWQRGTNENTNGLLRQYFAKGTDLSVFPADYLDYVAAKLNRRPRETLGWKTPAEALDDLLSNPSKPPVVASTA
jgi:IS30 family transposase